MSIQDDVSKLRQALKNVWDVCHDTWTDSAYIVAIMVPKTEAGKDYPPFASCTIGDYNLKFDEADGFTASYEPKDGKHDDYVLNVDPSRIVSFTMPPVSKDHNEHADPTHLIEFEIDGGRP